MARAIWTGSVSFGLVSIPVGLYSATEDKTVHFHQFQEGTTDRVRNKRVNERTGREVEYGDIVKGYEVGDEEYVMVSPDELEQVEPGRSRTIDITDFVDAADIDPIYYQHTYYLGPRDDTATKPYGLLLKAMQKSHKIAIATLIMRGKQYLASIRPAGPGEKVLALATMFFADEVRDPKAELDDLPSSRGLKDADVKMAVSLIDSMAGSWDPEDYRDEYRDKVMQLIEDKGAGKKIAERDEPEEAEVVDLVDALRRSVDAAKKRRSGGSGGSGKAGTPARRTRGGRSDQDAGDLDGLDKQQLYAIAQELDLAGRSSMSAAQLRTAIGRARAKAS